MKNIIYLLTLVVFFSSYNSELYKDKLEDFVVTNYVEKISGEEAIDKLKENAAYR